MEDALVELRLEDGDGSGEVKAWDVDQEVVKGSPWTFNNHLLVIQTLKEGDDPLEVSLLYTVFWVQIHNLPSGMYLEAMAKQFRDFIEFSLNYDAKVIVARLRNLMRIRNHYEGWWSVAVFWLRELGSIWGVNVGESGGDKGMINRNIIFPNFMCDANINLGINLAGKVNLPYMVESDRAPNGRRRAGSCVTGHNSKPMTIAPNASNGGLMCRWGSFGPQKLARFGKLLEKPVRLKIGWPDNEDMAT
ncbi:hypothetical protein Goari_011826 [Gossypium aridum]|uniref:DUF4283 domain-containing protein n=1 Tax=Gossypium aridum TaxID=34290 RepID=A0A7J8WZL3_GOSAI|nr:hypothetical protein [Gossypium aridum]